MCGLLVAYTLVLHCYCRLLLMEICLCCCGVWDFHGCAFAGLLVEFGFLFVIGCFGWVVGGCYGFGCFV